MSKRVCCGVAVSVLCASPGYSAEPGSAPVPKSVVNLKGCWQGRGVVMDKAVAIAISAKPIVQGAMLAVDAESSALTDGKDTYSAHLIFGGLDKADSAVERVTGFWTDSFGGGFAAPGAGESVAGGFNITYRYPDDTFVNRWRLNGSQLSWIIVAQDGKGVEAPFASYSLSKTACASGRKQR